MKPRRPRMLVALALTALMLGMAPPGTRAATPAAAPPTTDTAAGVIAAIGCGLGIRSFNALMPAGVAGALIVVSLCAYMLFDAMATPDTP